MSQRERPLGVTILAALYFVGVATYSALFVLSAVSADGLRMVLQSLSPGGAGPTSLLALGRALPFYFGVMVVAVAALGFGLWKLKNWARIVTLLIAAVSFIGTLLSLGAMEGSLTGVALGVLRFGLPIAVTWYLVKPGVRSVFRPGTGVPAR